MARRRRKKNATSKAALEFVESPTGGPPNFPSPVFCNDDPPTASVVPIEEGINFSWVSPQFRHPLSPQKRRRHARARGGNTLNSRAGQLTGKENSSMQPPAQGRKITQKFTTLKFVAAEHSPTVNISDDDVDAGNGAHSEIFHTPVRRRVTRSRSSGLNKYSDRRVPDVGNCNIVTTQVQPTSLLDTRCRIPSDVSAETACDVDRHRLAGIHVATSDGHSDVCNSPVCETQRRPKTRSTRQSTRRLFSTETPPQTHMHLLEHATSLSRSLDNVVDDNETEEPTCDNSINTPVLNQECSRSLDKGRTRRTAKPLWLFMETPIKDTSTCPQPTVLVADTPVEDYALPVRLRNLKYCRMLVRNNKSRLHPC